MEHGRLFLHEHPLGAKPWGLLPMQSLMQGKEVIKVKTDRCRFGMKRDESDRSKSLVKKPTRFITNSWGIVDELDQRCQGGHGHRYLVAGCAKGA